MEGTQICMPQQNKITILILLVLPLTLLTWSHFLLWKQYEIKFDKCLWGQNGLWITDYEE